MYPRRHRLQHRQTQLGNQCPRGKRRQRIQYLRSAGRPDSRHRHDSQVQDRIARAHKSVRSDNQLDGTLRIGLTCKVNAAKPHNTICSIDAFNAAAVITTD